MAVIHLPEPKDDYEFPPLPSKGPSISNIPFQKYYDFYVKVMDDNNLKKFFEDAILMKKQLLFNAEIKKELDLIEAAKQIDELENIINEKIIMLSSGDIKINYPPQWFSKEILDFINLYGATFNDVYLSSEILKEFREYLEINKNTNVYKPMLSKVEQKYNEYLKIKPDIIKNLKKSTLRYFALDDIILNRFLTIGVSVETLELKRMKTNRMSEAKEILNKNEESIEKIINFIKSLTYEQIELIVELYDLLLKNQDFRQKYNQDKEQIEKEHEDYISEIWVKSYEEMKVKDSNFEEQKNRILIEYSKMLLLEKIGKYHVDKDNFNIDEYNNEIYEAIKEFFEINSTIIKSLDDEVYDYICNYFDNKLLEAKVLKK